MVLLTQQIFAFLFLLCIFSTKSAKVKWRPNKNFNSPSNFVNQARPCGKQNVHFPSNLVSAVEISDTNEVSELLLPVDGELQLKEGAVIYFGPKDNQIDVVCPKNDAYYIEKSKLSWLQADVWESDRHTAATPDSQRVPCFDDDVVFPNTSQFSVKLPNFTQHVRSIRVGDRMWDLESFENALQSEVLTESFILNDFLDFGLKIESKSCQSRAGCPCQDNATKIDCSLKFCDIPRCRSAVTPHGNCCPICGGVLEFDININTFNFAYFMEQVEQVVEENGGSSAIAVHVGLLWKDRVQVVMMDRGEYDGVSTLAVHLLARSLSADVAGRPFKQVLLSGAPLSKVWVSWKVVGATLVTVVLVFLALYVWYERPDLLNAMPLSNVRPQRTTTMFTRFQNRTNSITSFMSRGSVALRSSFRNPMFATQRARFAKSEDEVHYHNEDVSAPGVSRSLNSADEISQVSLIPDLE